MKVRSTVTADDDLIDGLIKTAREEYEHESGEITTTRTITEYWDDWPTDGRTIELTVGPVASVSSVKYKPDGGTLTLIDSSNYTTDLVSTRARIYFNEDYTLPEMGTTLTVWRWFIRLGYRLQMFRRWQKPRSKRALP